MSPVDLVGYSVGLPVATGSPIPFPTDPHLTLMRRATPPNDYLLAGEWDREEREAQGYVEVAPAEA